MSIWVTDVGSRYIVKNENLTAAYDWLEAHYERACTIGEGNGVTVLGPAGCECMFCGNVSYSNFNYAKEFINAFCEPGSYGCFRNDDELEYVFIWKDESGIWDAYRSIESPFASAISVLENTYQL